MKFKAYHGSKSIINNFSDEFIGGTVAGMGTGGIDAEGPGIYFTNSKENAKMWGTYIYEVYLTPKKYISNMVPAKKANRIDLKKLLDMQGEDYSQNWDENINIDKLKAIEASIKYSNTEDEVFHGIRQEQYSGAKQRFVRDMTKLGYDMSLIYKDDFKFDDVDKAYHYIVYNPKIIEIIGVEKNVDGEVKSIKNFIRECVSNVLNEEMLNKDLDVYHGADYENILSLLNSFKILSPEQKMQFPSTGGGNFGLSATIDPAIAKKYSRVFGNDKILKLILKKDAKIKYIYDGAIDEVFCSEEMEQMAKHGYDAIIEMHGDAEKEVRILKPDKINVVGII